MKRRDLVLALGAAVIAAPAHAAEVPFSSWLAQLREEGARRGLSRRTLDEGLAGVAPIERVIELDRKQPEVTLTFAEYMARVVNQARIETGRQRLSEHRALLESVSARFGVQPRFMVSLWAIETDFGRITGNFPVVSALATLAYDGRRSQYFREELFNALKIVDRGHIAAKDMRGSWAGAMGQCQFMPSSYLSYAFDWDGDGKSDIWRTLGDVFASTANYLSRVGWKGDETWGREVLLPTGFDATLADYQKVQKSLAEWQTIGLRRADGGELPSRALSASVVRPGGEAGPAFLIYNNYRAILRWNRSLYFATAVGHLADRLGEA